MEQGKSHWVQLFLLGITPVIPSRKLLLGNSFCWSKIATPVCCLPFLIFLRQLSWVEFRKQSEVNAVSIQAGYLCASVCEDNSL